MSWITETIITTAMDSDAKDPAQAREEIKKMADNLNILLAARGASDGVASLGGTGKVPVAQLPVLGTANGGTGNSSYSIGDILFASSPTALSKLAAGTNGHVLTSNGPGVAPSWKQAGGGLTAGVRMLFQQTTAPTGWTKETNSAYNDVSVRLVTGSATVSGAEAFSSVFGSAKNTGGHNLTLNQVQSSWSAGQTGGLTAVARVSNTNAAADQSIDAHSHTLNLDLKYVDFIIAQKD